jgi:hypothetical protein
MATFTKPTNAVALATFDGLRNSSAWAKEYVQDIRIVNLLNVTGACQNATGPANLFSFGTGHPALAEVNTSETAGYLLNADSESHGLTWELPHDLDPNQDIDFRVKWSNSEAAATGSVLFSIVYTPVVIGGTTALAVAATALDTIIVNQVDLAANVKTWTSWGTITGGKTGIVALCPGTDEIVLKCAVDLTTCADATLFQIQARYRRRFV